MNFKNIILIFFVSLISIISSFGQVECGTEHVFASYTGECPEVDLSSQCITLDATESIDPTGIPVSFTWKFGDGKFGKGNAVTHCYAKPGTYNALMIATAKEKSGTKLVDEYPVEIVIDNMVNIDQVDVVISSQGFPFYFKGTNSFIEQGANINEYYWDFGDGVFACGAIVFHKFKEKGTHSVRLLIDANSKDGTPFQICGTKKITVQ